MKTSEAVVPTAFATAQTSSKVASAVPASYAASLAAGTPLSAAIVSTVRFRFSRALRNRATELRLIELMREHGITGWRRNARVFGKPDFVFRSERIAVFVDGCFWHGCPRHATKPATRAAWWAAKLARNAQRDREVTRALRASGWTVLRIWECALVRSRAGRTMARIAHALGRE